MAAHLAPLSPLPLATLDLPPSLPQFRLPLLLRLSPALSPSGVSAVATAGLAMAAALVALASSLVSIHDRLCVEKMLTTISDDYYSQCQ